MTPFLPIPRMVYLLSLGWLAFFSFTGNIPALANFHPAVDTDTLAEARRLYRDAMKAYQEKQYALCMANLRRVLQLRPDYPLAIYNLAAVNALIGNRTEAIRYLNQLAGLGLYADAAADEDFKAIREEKVFKKALARLGNNKKPVGRSQLVFSLPEKALITEGIAYWPAANTFYISSVHQRKIVAVDARQRTSDFSFPRDSLWAVQGVVVDTVRQWLWASSTAYPQMEGFQPKDKGRTGIFRYDLRTGKLAERYLAKDGLAQGLGDIVLGPTGEVYAADQTGAIYRITENELRVWLPAGQLDGPQGMAFSADGKYLFMADYPTGVVRIDTLTRTVTPLVKSVNTCLMGIDGLYFYRNALVAVQNGTTPHRLLRLSLNATQSTITRVTVLEANHPLWNEPTLGVRLNDDFYYIANSQWGTFNPDGSLPLDKLQPPVVLKIRLK